jgi:transcriptional regulator with XRE-family HTH domain
MDQEFSLGTRLRDLRKERKLTQRDLACNAGISVNAISLIERDEISPSVATLQSLAAALKIKMSYFFDDNAQTNVTHLRADKRPSITSNGITIESVGRHLSGQQIEPFFIGLAPHSTSGKQQVAHSGHEFVYCLSGMVEYEVEGQKYLLEPGDVLLFEAVLPHHWQNPTSEKSELLIILQTSEETSEPIRRHFPNHPSLGHLE